MKKLATLTISLILSAVLFAQNSQRSLHVTPNGHYLQYDDGTPFFWLGDTAWELFHRLTLEETEIYLNNRQAKGFNVIQAVILAELDGLRQPNRYGELPLLNMNPDTPNEKYFVLIDSVVQSAAEKGLIMALLPTWADKVTLDYGGQGPVVFNAGNAYRYGLFLGARYKKFNHIVWVLGGDRPPEHNEKDWKPIYAAMAKGLDDGAEKHVLKTFHPGGSVWESSIHLHNEPWMDFNMIQSGHGEQDQPVWKNVYRDWNLLPAKPVIDSEPNYEDLTVNPWSKSEAPKPIFTEYDVRKQLYRSVFAGGFGVTYGQSSIWRMHNEDIYQENPGLKKWSEMLDRPGAFQAGYLRQLMESRPMLNRVPDDSIILEGQGVKADYITAFRDEKGRYIMVYLPVGKTITVDVSSITSKQVVCSWFNPKDGKTKYIGKQRKKNEMQFTPPVLGEENDWVLVIDDASKKYNTPRKTK